MEKYMKLSKDEIVMGFVASCIESVADRLGVGYLEIFERMEKVGIFTEARHAGISMTRPPDSTFTATTTSQTATSSKKACTKNNVLIKYLQSVK